MDDVRQAFERMVAIETEAQNLLTAINELRALFPGGELPHYLGYVEEAIDQVEPTLEEIVKARPY